MLLNILYIILNYNYLNILYFKLLKYFSNTLLDLQCFLFLLFIPNLIYKDITHFLIYFLNRIKYVNILLIKH